MEPGESGRDRASRAGQDAAALEAQARELLARAGQARQAAERYSRGHDGEQMIGALLGELGPQGWRVLHDRRRQPRSPANLDHVLIGPAGVFVIDAKNWTGGRLRQDERGMAVGKWRKDDELHSAKVDADIVREHVDGLGERAGTAAVVAFVHDMGLPAPVQQRGVVLLQREQLLPWLTSLPSRLGPDQVSYLAAALDMKFPPRLLPPTSHAVGTASSVRALPTGARAGGRRPAPAVPAQALASAPARATTAAQRKKDRERDKARRALKSVLVRLAVVAAILPFTPWIITHVVGAATPTIISHLVPATIKPTAPATSTNPHATARHP